MTALALELPAALAMCPRTRHRECHLDSTQRTARQLGNDPARCKHGAILPCRCSADLEQKLFDMDQPQGRLPLGSRSIEQLGHQIASPAIHAGGGSAAAAAASLAAATAELVVTLTLKRAPSGDVAQTADHDARRLKELRTALLDAGDADESALDRLMQTYRTKGASRSAEFVDAAGTSLAVAGLAQEVIEIAAREVPFASRFTASDLGAAASLAHGAATAALLTARINIQLLVREGQSLDATRDELGERAAVIDRAAQRAVDDALSATQERIDSPGRQQA